MVWWPNLRKSHTPVHTKTPPSPALRRLGHRAGPSQPQLPMFCIVAYGDVQLSMASMTVSEARAALPDLLARVEGGEEVTLTRHGRPVAVVVRPDVLNVRRAQAALANAEKIHELLATGRVNRLSGSAGLTAQRADELVQEIREGRDRG